MSSSYQADILAQPTALRDTWEHLSSQRLPAEIRDGFSQGKWKRVILTGMGSSYFALLPLYLRFVEQGVSAWLLETSELIYQHAAYLVPDTLVIAASQSGASAETMHLLERFGQRVTVLGLSNTPGSPLASGAAFTVLTRAGEEATVSCKTYVAALVGQAWLGSQLLASQQEFFALEGAAAVFETYLGHWQDHLGELKTILSGVSRLFYTGRGASLAAVGVAGLTTKESVQMPAEGLSSAAFRHGPFEMIGPETFVLVFLGQGESAQLNQKLFRDISAAGGRAALVQYQPDSGVFHLPGLPGPALPLLEILPAQMMTLALAELRGIQAGNFRLATKITATE